MSGQTTDARNPSQLRAGIDQGRAADKAPFPDPAAAPLGTDDEAAGTPNTAAQVTASMAQEVGTRPTDTDANAASPTGSDATPALREGPSGAAGGARLGDVKPWYLVAAVLFVVAVGVAVFLAMRTAG